PFGLEDARTGLAQGWVQKFLQHRPAPVMQRAKRKIKRGGRFPASPSGASLRTPPVRQDPADSNLIHRLFGRLGHRKYRHDGAAIGFGAELDTAFNLGKESMVGAHADIKAGMPGGAALTRDDVAGNHVLAAERLDPEPLARRITSVSR